MKRIVSAVLCFCLLTGTLFGCSGNTAAPAASGSGASSGPAAVEPEKVTLNVMMSFPRFMDQMQAYTDQFKKKELSEKNVDVTVNLEMPSSEQYETTLKTRLSSNDAPDLFTISASADLATYQKAGYLTDLSDQPFVSTLYPNVKKTVTYDGKVYLVPFESTVWGYLYNKDIFKKCGLTKPETLDAMKAAVSALKSKGYTPFELAFQEQWVPQLMTALTLGGLVSGSNPDWVQNMYADKASYKDVAGIFESIDLIMQNGTARAMETGSEQGCTDFANGKAAMFVDGTWAAESIMKANPDMQLGVGAFPVDNNPKDTMINLATTTALAVYANTKQQKTALDLANYILDGKDSSKLYHDLMFNPVANFQNFEQYSWSEEASQYVQQGRAYTDLVLPNAVTDEQGKLLQSYYLKKVTKDQFIETMDKTFKEANEAAKQANG